MPLQNRVTPFGTLESVPERGTWTGNRGILVDDHSRIVAAWRSKAWITCRLHYKGVQRQVASPHSWTELFFLDEATAFAAGHRPCAYCRRGRYNAFKQAWLAANPMEQVGREPRITAIDAVLHRERLAPDRRKRTWLAPFGDLPHGTFIAIDGRPLLVWRDRLFIWSHAGYTESRLNPSADTVVSVLTPPSIVAMFRNGFRPQVHPSAFC